MQPHGSSVDRASLTPAGVLRIDTIDGDEISFEPFKRFLGRNWRHLLIATVVGLGLGLAWIAVRPQQYRAGFAFAPQSRSPQGGIAALAAQFGLSQLASDGGRSPAFYQDLFTTDEFLQNIAKASYKVQDDGVVRQGDLGTWLKVKESSPTERLFKTTDKLRKIVSIGTSLKSGLITVTVTTKYPELSEQIAANLLEAIGTFNNQSRKAQATAERQFTERRMQEAGAELRTAEDRLQQFLESNRTFRSSPELTVSYDRLSRNVSFQQQIYTTLSQAYEQARIEEVRDTPSITIVERPLPARRLPRPWTNAIGLAMLATILAAAGLAFRDHRRKLLLDAPVAA